MEIIARLIDNKKKCIGYLVEDKEKNKRYKLSSGKTWDMIINGRIGKVTAKVISGKKCILSTDECIISSIPKISV